MLYATCDLRRATANEALSDTMGLAATGGLLHTSTQSILGADEQTSRIRPIVSISLPMDNLITAESTGTIRAWGLGRRSCNISQYQQLKQVPNTPHWAFLTDGVVSLGSACDSLVRRPARTDRSSPNGDISATNRSRTANTPPQSTRRIQSACSATCLQNDFIQRFRP